MDEKCENCKYCVTKLTSFYYWECHKSPPVVVVVDGVEYNWPEVKQTDWCGEWKPAEGMDDGDE